MIPPQSSLVKYNNPILVSTTKEKTLKAKKAVGGKTPAAPAGGNQGPEAAAPPPKPTVFTGSNSTSTSATEDILNSILPPKEWTEDGQLWVQYVSSTPATRLDVVNLQEQLDLRLQQRQARETGICPVREELYAQCFGTVHSSLGWFAWCTNRSLPCSLNRRTDPANHHQLLRAWTVAAARAR